MQVRLRKLPTGGVSSPNITPGISLQDFANAHNIQDRDIVVDGASIPKGDWSQMRLQGGERITATTSTKGA